MVAVVDASSCWLAATSAVMVCSEGACTASVAPTATTTSDATHVDTVVDDSVAVTAVVATGGLSQIVVSESRTSTHHEPDLTLLGLALLFEKNQV